MGKEEFGSFRHLAHRFFGALSSAEPAPVDEAWVAGILLPGEHELWRRMSGPDRRHAIGVARDTEKLLGAQPARDVTAAALLHDVGKVEASFGTFARVGVTMAAIVGGRARLAGWADSATGGWRYRTGRYLTHDRIGADLLAAAGSAPLTVAWAGEHHLPEDRWTVDRRIGEALKAADGD